MPEVFDHIELTLESQNPEFEKGKVKVKLPAGTTRPALAWKARFQRVKEAALEDIQEGTPSQYVCIGRETKPESAAYGQWMRSCFIKNKDKWLVPGVWSLRSRKYFDQDDVFVASEIQARFLSENPIDPNAVLVVSGMGGRPKIERPN